MWKSYLKTSLRNLRNHKFYTLNTVLCLTLGFSATFYIITYTRFERSFDDQTPDKQHKVRLIIDKYRSGELTVSSAETYTGCGPALYDQIPEIVSYTRTFNMASRMNAVISYENPNTTPVNVKLKDYYYADSTFLKFFGYTLSKGDRDQALRAPYSAVITKELATTYFGDQDPMGKSLRYRDEEQHDETYVITGVLEETPTNSHLPFHLLLSYSTFGNRSARDSYMSSWNVRKSYTYLKLSPQATLSQVEAKLPELIKKNKVFKDGEEETLTLQPFASLHFSSQLSDQPSLAADQNMLDFLDIVAILILFIAAVNFINLSTSALANQAEEVGVRKILGASKKQLVIQYYLQCILINFLSAALGIIILITSWPTLNRISGANIPLQLLLETPFLLFAIAILILNTLISGLLPALILTTIDPTKIISGILKLTRGKFYRHMLITGQFAISFCLIMATLIVFKQLQFMQKQNLGVNIDQILVVRVPGILPDTHREVLSNQYRGFVQQAETHPSIRHASVSLTIPGHERAFRTGTRLQDNPSNTATIRFNGTDPSFLETFQLTLLAGRNFNEQHNSRQDTSIILSESAAQVLGFTQYEDAIGAIVEVPAFRLVCRVIGIVNDYRLASVKSEAEPMAFLHFEPIRTNFFSFKLQGRSYQDAVEHIKSAWHTNFPGNPFDYFFLDDFFNAQYHQEQQLIRLLALFGGLAILLAVLGLVGLTSFMVQQRTKEIGVRKVMGSSIIQIFSLLAIRLLGLVSLASLLGAGLIYYFSHEWLKQFPIRTPLPLWLYLLPLLLLLALTLFSISFQALKAARINPVEALRHK